MPLLSDVDTGEVCPSLYHTVYVRRCCLFAASNTIQKVNPYNYSVSVNLAFPVIGIATHAGILSYTGIDLSAIGVCTPFSGISAQVVAVETLYGSAPSLKFLQR